jgi:hypothetical protein
MESAVLISCAHLYLSARRRRKEGGVEDVTPFSCGRCRRLTSPEFIKYYSGMTYKRRAARSRRRRAATSFRKLAVSVPTELVKAVADEVRARRTQSVSAFISDAVEEKLERDQLQEALDEVWREKPMTQRERVWADKILRV